MKLHDIFTPNAEPTITYVQRSELKLEESLNQYYLTPNLVVSISGPSKSGKTVLINKIIPSESLIPVVGAGISSPENLWERVLQWMDVPASVTTSDSSITGGAASATGGGEIGIPLVAKGMAQAKVSVSKSKQAGKSTIKYEDPLLKVIAEIAGSDFAIFIDDFHYIDEQLREEIGRQIKVAAEAGVKFITASVPHRTDDVVRSNSELRGRVAAVDLQYWSVAELARIPRLGLAAFNAEIAPSIETKLATEAFGSPQLMQSICMNLCMVLDLYAPLETQERMRVTKVQITETLRRTSSFADFSRMLSSLLSGPRVRGTERKIHSYTDGSEGDVYRAVLLAVSQDPASLSFSYEDIQKRIREICTGDVPTGSSITSALEQMNIIAENLQPNASPISWDNDNLDIVDPYLLFFLRCSEKL